VPLLPLLDALRLGGAQPAVEGALLLGVETNDLCTRARSLPGRECQVDSSGFHRKVLPLTAKAGWRLKIIRLRPEKSPVPTLKASGTASGGGGYKREPLYIEERSRVGGFAVGDHEL
jgi:hypothetical protein